MYWSKAPVYGVMPAHGMRAHSVTLIDSVAWIFGGCDERGCWKDVWCFNTETMQWSHPETLGDVPPPCRAHTSTLVDRRLIIFGGGEGPVYRNDVYILDTPTRRWYQPRFPPDMAIPPPRRAHTTIFYKNKVWVFGGGNGSQALNDLWTLDCGTYGNAAAAGGGVAWGDRMKWEMVNTKGRKPTARGYHTANLVGSVMVVMGGSDGRECFSDIWCLNLGAFFFSFSYFDVIYRRLSHTATQVGSYLFIWGGHDGTQYTSDLLLFNLVSLTFETRPIGGKPPSPRGYHAALIADSRLFVFGGFNGNEVFDDVYNLDLAGAAYLPQVTSFKIDVD
ncbi:galactose oxidase [Abortiporus biennis]|nr:galactose oxidase [Abortiporus biennis]